MGIVTAQVMPTRQRVVLGLETALAAGLASVLFALVDGDLRGRLFAGLSAALLMQCDAGRTRPDRQRTLLGMGAAMTVAVALGLLSLRVQAVHEAGLVGAAFLVFFARERLQGRPRFTVYVFVAYVITGLAGASGTPPGVGRTLLLAGAVTLGMGTSFVVRFYLLPQSLSNTLARLFVRSTTLTDEASASPPSLPARAPTHLMPVRAAVVAIAAIAVSHAFKVERAYWMELAAVVLVNETLNESARKSAERFGMTLGGCAIGWGLHQLLFGHPWPERAGLLLAVFLAAFFRPVSYPKMVLFITVYVSFLFSLLGQWTLHVLALRIIDTGIGGALAVAGALLVRPRAP